jgi:hypothetical protein
VIEPVATPLAAAPDAGQGTAAVVAVTRLVTVHPRRVVWSRLRGDVDTGDGSRGSRWRRLRRS